MNSTERVAKSVFWLNQLDEIQHEYGYLEHLLDRSLFNELDSLKILRKGFGINIGVGYERLKSDNLSSIPHHVSVKPVHPTEDFVLIWVKDGDFHWSKEFDNLIVAKFWLMCCLLTYLNHVYMREPSDELENSLESAIRMISNAENILNRRVKYEVRNQ